MKQTSFLAIAFLLSGICQTTTAQNESATWGFNDIPTNSQVNQMSGPRFGLTYLSEGSGAQFLNRVHEMDSAQYHTEFGAGLPFTSTTQYGWQWETRFADTGGPVVGLVEWVALIGGMEKGMFLRRFRVLLAFVLRKGLSLPPDPT